MIGIRRYRTAYRDRSGHDHQRLGAGELGLPHRVYLIFGQPREIGRGGLYLSDVKRARFPAKLEADGGLSMDRIR